MKKICSTSELAIHFVLLISVVMWTNKFIEDNIFRGKNLVRTIIQIYEIAKDSKTIITDFSENLLQNVQFKKKIF